jgi:hypothetical protein
MVRGNEPWFALFVDGLFVDCDGWRWIFIFRRLIVDHHWPREVGAQMGRERKSGERWGK